MVSRTDARILLQQGEARGNQLRAALAARTADFGAMRAVTRAERARVEEEERRQRLDRQRERE